VGSQATARKYCSVITENVKERVFCDCSYRMGINLFWFEKSAPLTEITTLKSSELTQLTKSNEKGAKWANSQREKMHCAIVLERLTNFSVNFSTQ